MAKTRAYLVETTNGKRIIEASTAAQATNFVIRDEVKVKALTTGELIQHLKDGLKVENSTPTPIEEHIEGSKADDAAEGEEEEGEENPETSNFGRRFLGRKTA